MAALKERARLPARPLSRRAKAFLGLGTIGAWFLALRRVEAVPGLTAPATLPPRMPSPRARSWKGVFQETMKDYAEDEIPRRGAALAYYTVFSMAPLVLIMISIVGLVMGPEAAEGIVEARMSGFLGPQGSSALQQLVQGAQRPTAGTIAGIIGIFTLLLGAGAVVGELQASLGKIWGVVPKSGGLWYMIRTRLVSVAFVLALGFLLLVSLLAGAAIAAMAKYASGALGVPEAGLQVFNQAFSLVVIGSVFALMFRYLPEVRMPWRVVLVGGMATALLFTIGNTLLTLYLGKGGPTSTYGAAGSILALLLWAFYSAQILYLGAEFTEAYAYRRGVALSRE